MPAELDPSATLDTTKIDFACVPLERNSTSIPAVGVLSLESQSPALKLYLNPSLLLMNPEDVWKVYPNTRPWRVR